MTGIEIADTLGLHNGVVRRHIRRMVALGELEHSLRRYPPTKATATVRDTIRDLLRDQPNTTGGEIAATVGVSATTVSRIVRQLVADGELPHGFRRPPKV